jgi:hypothetical protein
MKKLLAPAVIILSFLFFTPSSAQSFQSGSLIASGSFGIDLLRTNYTQTINYFGLKSTQSNTGGAATSTPQIGAEYGVNNW